MNQWGEIKKIAICESDDFQNQPTGTGFLIFCIGSLNSPTLR